jgi:hypothetical protein
MTVPRAERQIASMYVTFSDILAANVGSVFLVSHLVRVCTCMYVCPFSAYRLVVHVHDPINFAVSSVALIFNRGDFDLPQASAC